VLVILLKGELDVDTAPALEHQLGMAERRGVRHLVVDLTELEFVDSRGLKVFIDLQRRAAGHGWQLTLRPARSQAVQRLFEIVGVERMFSFEPEPEPAPADDTVVKLDLGAPAAPPDGTVTA
jgi:anti-anti-sigma factor